jgi:hypothetical protein
MNIHPEICANTLRLHELHQLAARHNDLEPLFQQDRLALVQSLCALLKVVTHKAIGAAPEVVKHSH